MKTNLFYAISRSSEAGRQFLSDLAQLLGMEEEHRTACLDILSQPTEQVMTANQRRELIQQLPFVNEVGFVNTAAACQALQFLADALLDDECRKDQIQDLAADLLECAQECKSVELSQEKIKLFANLVEKLRREILPDFEKAKDRRTTAGGVLPSLKSFGTTVEARAIVKNPFRIGMKADVYDPEVSGFVPVVSVKLSADSGAAREFAFQASKAELGALIEELKSAYVALGKIQSYIDDWRQE